MTKDVKLKECLLKQNHWEQEEVEEVKEEVESHTRKEEKGNS